MQITATMKYYLLPFRTANYYKVWYHKWGTTRVLTLFGECKMVQTPTISQEFEYVHILSPRIYSEVFIQENINIC
jgi:hypothetical protein